MARTYSLSRLLLCVTLFSAFCGLAVNFPESAILLAGFALIMVPTFVVWRLMVRFSSEPILMTVNMVCGALISLVFTMLTMPALPYGWIVSLALFAIPPAFGAFVFGGLALTFEPPTTPTEQK